MSNNYDNLTLKNYHTSVHCVFDENELDFFLHLLLLFINILVLNFYNIPTNFKLIIRVYIIYIYKSICVMI